MTTAVPQGFVRFEHGGPYDAAFGAVWVHHDRHVCGFRVEQRHCNVMGSCHGGAMATFLDAQILAAFGEPRLEHMPTITLTVDYVAPALVGSWVEAAVTLIRATRTMVFTQAVVTADGAVVARSNGIYRNAREPRR